MDAEMLKKWKEEYIDERIGRYCQDGDPETPEMRRRAEDEWELYQQRIGGRNADKA